MLPLDWYTLLAGLAVVVIALLLLRVAYNITKPAQTYGEDED